MAKQDFKAVFIPIAVWICTLLDIVSMATPPPPPPWAMYYKETGNADFGIRMKYDSTTDKAMTVTISYDSETKSAYDFFHNQISAKLIDDFSGCGVITWKFHPCTTSKIDQGALICANEKQCNYDQVQSCIADALGANENMGKFLRCFFGLGGNTASCSKLAGVDETKVNDCVSSGQGAQKCNAYHTIFEDARSKRTQSEAENTAKYPDAIANFKSVTCQVLAQGSLSCPGVCNS